MQTSISGPPAEPTTQMEVIVVPDARGKHRLHAELKRLEQETRFLEEELNGLEHTDLASIACQELVSKIEEKPDPFLPVTAGPANPSWDQWFKGPQDLRCCRCWIL